MFTKGHGAKELVRFDALCKLFSVKIYAIQIKLSGIALSSYFWSIATVKTHKRAMPNWSTRSHLNIHVAARARTDPCCYTHTMRLITDGQKQERYMR